jgi:hypothetical protein
MTVFVGINKMVYIIYRKNEGIQSDCCSGILQFGNRG